MANIQELKKYKSVIHEWLDVYIVSVRETYSAWIQYHNTMFK